MTNPITIKGNSVCFGESGKIALRDFPARYQNFLNGGDRVATTHCLERQGVDIVRGSTRAAFVYRFVLCVSYWGKMERVSSRFIERNGGSKIAAQKAFFNAIQNAGRYLRISDVSQSLDSLLNKEIIRGLGVPFASKILRMLAPDKAVTLDNHLHRKLGIALNSEDYAKWCADCVLLSQELEKKHKHVVRPGRKWKAADVEAVIFDCVRGG